MNWDRLGRRNVVARSPVGFVSRRVEIFLDELFPARQSAEHPEGVLDTLGQTPINPGNFDRDQVKPMLTKAGVAWRGFHSFRRGLATNLHALEVQDIDIQQILRHSLAKIDSGALGGASGHHCLVFLFRLAGKKNPHGVDADRRSERNIEQRDEAEDECHDAGPGLALQQTPSRDKSESSLTENEYPHHAEQRMQEGWRSRSSSGREERVRDDIQNHAANRIQGREG
jgi:hypothetical protein